MKRLHELTTNTFESQPVSKKGRSNCKKLWKNARQINQTPSTILCESFVVNEHLKCLRLQYGRNTRNTTKGFSVSLEEKKSKSQFLLTFGLKEIKINHYEISSGQRKLSSSKPKDLKFRNDSVVTGSTGKMPCPSLGPGWYFQQVVRQQGKTAGKFDVYYYSPCGTKLRSKLTLQNFLGSDTCLDKFDYNLGRFRKEDEFIHKKDALFVNKLKWTNKRGSNVTSLSSNIREKKERMTKRLLYRTSLNKKLKKNAGKESKIFSTEEEKLSGFEAFAHDVLKAGRSFCKNSYSIGEITEKAWTLLDPWKKSWYLNNSFNVKKRKNATASIDQISSKRKACGTRAQRCGSCSGCRASNCRKCVYCRNMPKYGGRGSLKQSCIRRRCVWFAGKDKNASKTYSVLTPVQSEADEAEKKMRTSLRSGSCSSVSNDCAAASCSSSSPRNVALERMDDKEVSRSRKNTVQSYSDRQRNLTSAGGKRDSLPSSMKSLNDMLEIPPEEVKDDQPLIEKLGENVMNYSDSTNKTADGTETELFPLSSLHNKQVLARPTGFSNSNNKSTDDAPSLASSHATAEVISSVAVTSPLCIRMKSRSSLPCNETKTKGFRGSPQKLNQICTKGDEMFHPSSNNDVCSFAASALVTSDAFNSGVLRSKSSLANIASLPATDTFASPKVRSINKHLKSPPSCENSDVKKVCRDICSSQANVPLKPFVNLSKVMMAQPTTTPCFNSEQFPSGISSQPKQTFDSKVLRSKLAFKSTSRKSRVYSNVS